MNNKLISQVNKKTDLKYIFCDYYDTVVHRKVHPLRPFKIWAQLVKQEMDLSISTHDLYEMRRVKMKALSVRIGRFESELSYDMVMEEIYQELVNLDKIHSHIPFKAFLDCASEADYKSESRVQYVNKKMVHTLQILKNKGFSIYCVSDFYWDEALMSRLMKYHNIYHLYDKVFVSAAQNASKENSGVLFKRILENQGISSNEVLMVGDNPISDVAHAKLHGIDVHYLKRYKYKLRQKFLFLEFLLSN